MGVMVPRTALLGVLVGALVSGKAHGDEPSAVVRRWAEQFSAVRAVRVDWRVEMKSRDRSTNQPDGGGVAEKTSTVFRWPDCYAQDRKVLDTAPPERLTPEAASSLKRFAPATRNGREVLTPARRRVTLSETPGMTFDDNQSYGTLRDHAIEFAEESPFLVAHWLIDVGLAEPDRSVTSIGPGVIRADFPSKLATLTFAADSRGEITLKSVERGPALPAGRGVRWELSDWSRVDPSGPPVPRRRVLSTIDPATGQYRQWRDERLLAFECIPPPADDVFTPDLSKVLVADQASGVVRDADDKVVGRIRPLRLVSTGWQWAILLGSGGAGLLGTAVVILWWRARSRHAR